MSGGAYYLPIKLERNRIAPRPLANQVPAAVPIWIVNPANISAGASGQVSIRRGFVFNAPAGVQSGVWVAPAVVVCKCHDARFAYAKFAA